ncbi:hypothetical protein ACEPPN_013251 [Leptodophora sp. 'Broadleaf-Isolate-01']
MEHAPDRESLYQPLDQTSGEIRLLSLVLPGPHADEGSLIEIEMRHAPLAQVQTTYIALSYTWGDAKSTKSIRINGQEIRIRENLYDFLLRYRECMTDLRDGRDPFDSVEFSAYYQLTMDLDELKYSEQGQPRWLENMPIWIDALCMDQNNVSELNDNVPRMKDIYEKSLNVVVWLGNETETSKDAMIFLQNARMKFGENRQNSMFNSVLGIGRVNGVSSRLGPAADLDEWKAAAELFDHPYWKRMWVVQELAYSFRNAYIWCGRRQMHVHSLAKVQRAYFGDELGDTGVRDYTHPRYDQAENVPPSLIRGGPWPMEIVRDLSDRPHHLAASGARSTREIMSVIRGRKATVPHDMIYALYKLIVPSSEHALIVNYDRSVAQVFCDYMEYELTVSKTLQIWQLLTEKKSNIEDLPSWAVDWTAQDEHHQLIHLKSAVTPPGPAETDPAPGAVYVNFASLRTPGLVPVAQDVNAAASTTTAVVRFLEPGKKIAITGVLIGTVDDGSYGWTCLQHPDDDDGSFWQEIEEVVAFLQGSSRSKVEKVTQIGSCLLFDDRIEFCNADDGKHIKFYGEHLLNVVLTVLYAGSIFRVYYGDAINQLLITSADESKVDRVPKLPQDRSHLAAQFRQKIKNNFWDRIWIINKKFDVLGIAPAKVQQGDILFVPYGCPLVMIMHDEGNGTFSVVGSCWLYGFMHGEAIKMHAEGTLEEKELILV